jgi:hypothetical protein
MIRYADDFVVLVRGTEAQAHAIKEQTAEFLRERMRLTLSPEKTAVTHVGDGFDLLGFRVKRAAWRGQKRVADTFPSRQALRAVMHRIKTLTNRSTVNLSLDQLIHVLNPILRGWANYYRHAASSRCFAYLSHYLWWRVIRWLRKKYPRLTWKQIRRRCWGHHWTSREGARLAWPDEGGGHAISLSRSPHRLAVGGHRNRPSHHSTGDHHCMTQRHDRPSRVLWRAGCAGTRMSGSEGGTGNRTGGNAGTAPRPDPARSRRGCGGRVGAGLRSTARPRGRARSRERGVAGAGRSGVARQRAQRGGAASREREQPARAALVWGR